MPTKMPALNLWTAMLGAPVTISTPHAIVVIESRDLIDEDGNHGSRYFVAGPRVPERYFVRIAAAWQYAIESLAKLKPDWPPTPEQVAGFRSA